MLKKDNSSVLVIQDTSEPTNLEMLSIDWRTLINDLNHLNDTMSSVSGKTDKSSLTIAQELETQRSRVTKRLDTIEGLIINYTSTSQNEKCLQVSILLDIYLEINQINLEKNPQLSRLKQAISDL